MRIVHFITHPEVVIDPLLPVTEWPLSAVGLQRVGAMLARPWVATVQAVFSSAERKALDMAHMVGDHLHVTPVVVDGLGENDRSATGYLPKAEFEAVADIFFARPEESVRGWERAVDAQRRIVTAVDHALRVAPAAGDVAIIAHGGVGALLLCCLKGIPISRAADQPGGGGGNFYSFDMATRRLIVQWRSIEA
jgi:broad specificity phosphatase PhoE